MGVSWNKLDSRSSARRALSRPAKGSSPDGKAAKPSAAAVWRESRALIWEHRRRLALGLSLMLVNRLAGLVLPALSKYLVDEVVAKHRAELLGKLALVAAGATLLQAVTSFILSQVLGVAAQRAITDMRRTVEAHVMKLPVRYFDSTKSGVLISRIMNDAEGIRNLVGTGLVQLTGGLVTAVIALGVLFYLNWRLTSVTLIVLGLFSFAMSTAFKRLRPLFRERGKINAWNSFVHTFSAREAQFLFLADADIVIHRVETLRQMLRVLENEREEVFRLDPEAETAELLLA